MLVLIGSNHTSAPVEFRERLALSDAHLPDALAALLCTEGIEEGMILSTCNRVEFLVRGSWQGAPDGVAALHGFLAGKFGVSADELDRYTYQHHGSGAVQHLFRVAGGLDSMILGEPQILGQVKQAYVQAKHHRTLGTVLDRLLQHSLSSAKRTRTETGISRNAVSVAYAAVELARTIFGNLHERTALLLGAGKMAALVARHLTANGVRAPIVASRSYSRASAMAQQAGGRAVHWDDGLAGLSQVDIVVASTGAPHTVLSREHVAEAIRLRRGEPLFLIDIAVPRDIEPAVNELQLAYLYDIDDLQSVVDSNRDERRRAAADAERLITQEVQAFNRWRQAQAVAPLIVELRERWHEIGRKELDRFGRRLGPLSVEQKGTLEQMLRTVIQKILHHPTRHLRHSAETGAPDHAEALYRELFGIDRSRSTRQPEKQDSPSGPRRLLRGGQDS